MLTANKFAPLWIALILSTSACTNVSTAPPAFIAGSEVTAENAANVTSFDPANITSVVDYYFASRIRGDDKWMDVMPPQDAWSDRLKSKLADHDAWGFLAYQVQGADDPEANEVSVDVKMTLSFEGDIESGVDSVILEQVDGKWIITDVPT